MPTDIIKRLLILAAVVIIQVLVLNHIHLFGCATPFLYILLPLGFGSNQSRWSALIWCFAIGLLVDIFANTPGVAAGSLTLIGLIQPYLFQLFISREEDEEQFPTIEQLGFFKYLAYCMILITIYCLAFFSLEAFSFYNILLWAESVGGSALLTTFVVICLAKINRK